MNKNWFAGILAMGLATSLAAAHPAHPVPPDGDWLLDATPYVATAQVTDDGRTLVLDNGLIRREIRLTPNAATTAFDNRMTGASLLRAVRPEARVTIDGVAHDVGGLTGQPNHAFLRPDWLDAMTATLGSFEYVGHVVSEPTARLTWTRMRHHAPDATWPPEGIAVRLDFRHPDRAIDVSVHYVLYDGLPGLSKWLTVHNRTEDAIELDRFTCEVLAVVEYANDVESRDGVPLLPPSSIHVETDYAMGGFTARNANRFAVHWRPDPDYHTQVNYRKQTPCLLEVEPTRGPDVMIPPGETFQSFRCFELVYDATDRERRGLALRRMYRTVAPWITENPLILHVVSTNPDVVRTAIDQAAECGFEMVSLSFGSGLNMEDGSEANRQKFADLVAYAAERAVHLGGYSLLSSRRIGDGQDVVSPEGERPTHGNCPALASEWGQGYFRTLTEFFESTGFLQFTHDGSYPGDFDITVRPPLQRGLDDSQWVQWRIITDFYRDLRARGVYLRVPDYYYLSGSNECGMGYREVNWSLPRDQQVIHTRQNIYDGTWEKTPSMGWMFVPLTQYHGGGAAATIEPLDTHLDHYERMLASNLALGVQAVYRGHRLYDTPRVRDAVRRWVDWYKSHRTILESDVIHGRRADGRRLDWMLHVDPLRSPRGMLVVFNPTDVAVTESLAVDLYYTAVRGAARVRAGDAASVVHPLGADHILRLNVSVPAGGMSWYVIDRE